MEEILRQILGELKDLKQGVSGLERGQKALEQRQLGLEQGQKTLEQGQKTLEQGQEELRLLFKAQQEALEKLNADLLGFKQETSERLDLIERQNRFFDSELDYLNREIGKVKRAANA